MKAVLSGKAGPPDILRIVDIPIPEPGAGEVRVRVHCATVTAGDAILRKMNRIVLGALGALFGFKAMKVPGVEFSGVIDAVGADIGDFAVGDQVRGTTTGLAYGANAEYVCVPAVSKNSVVIRKAPEISHADAAAATVGAMTAMQFVRKAELKSGEAFLVYGASGSVGSFAVQLGKHFGAVVIGVCSAANADAVKSLGADSVIDYAQEDFTTNGRRYDVIFDAVGKLSRSAAKGSLNPGGRFVSVKSPTKEVAAELEYVQDLQVKGEIKPLIDREFALEDIVEAHRLVESGRKRGNVLIRVAEDRD
jgi:NADPH:quinone reductase-like Zn-dependent oxidoreductase